MARVLIPGDFGALFCLPKRKRNDIVQEIAALLRVKRLTTFGGLSLSA